MNPLKVTYLLMDVVPMAQKSQLLQLCTTTLMKEIFLFIFVLTLDNQGYIYIYILEKSTTWLLILEGGGGSTM